MVDGRADIFSTGVVMYELLAGRKPFEADQPTATIVKILNDPPPPIENARAGPAGAARRRRQSRARQRSRRALRDGRRTEQRAAMDPAGDWRRRRRRAARGNAVRDAHGDPFVPGRSSANTDKEVRDTGRVRPRSAPAPTGMPKWAIPAAAAAVLVVGGLVAMLMSGAQSARDGAPRAIAAGSTATAPARERRPRRRLQSLDGATLQVSSETDRSARSSSTGATPSRRHPRRSPLQGAGSASAAADQARIRQQDRQPRERRTCAAARSTTRSKKPRSSSCRSPSPAPTRWKSSTAGDRFRAERQSIS